jgi:amino-acid N-acetyltransferase
MTHANFTLRRARPADAPRMMPLLEDYIKQAEILPRTEEDVCRSIREWVVAEAPDTRIVGMGSLLIMSPNLAEIRSLVVQPTCQGQGIGKQVVKLLLDEARALGIEHVIALTRKPDFFLKLDFQLTRLEKLPRKLRRDCVFCAKFHICDEVALEIFLKDAPVTKTMSAAESAKNGTLPQPATVLLTPSGVV